MRPLGNQTAASYAIARVILRFISGLYESAEFPVGKEPIRIGSHPDGEMVLLHDAAVSPEHARISVEDGTFVIEDLGSTEGTFVNGARIGRVALKRGDRIVIGAHVMEVRDR